MHRYLVVANQTLGGPELLTAIRDRMSRGPAEFQVLVPATSTTRLINDFNALSCAFPVDPDLVPGAADVRAHDDSVAEAAARLHTELSRLRSVGATVDGIVGDPDPMKAIGEAVAVRRFDEIILSTLPPGVSRWLAWDLPHRIRRGTDLPCGIASMPGCGNGTTCRCRTSKPYGACLSHGSARRRAAEANRRRAHRSTSGAVTHRPQVSCP
jgi:hypothetical protein